MSETCLFTISWWPKPKACINLGLQFFQRKFSQEFCKNVPAFRSARLCCPVKVQQLRPTAASVEELRRFRFLDNDAIIQGLTAELPRYLAVADGADLQTEEEKLQWWSRNEANLPNWSSVVKEVLFVQPSFASAERVFSIMKNFFTNQQDAAQEQTVEASVMLCLCIIINVICLMQSMSATLADIYTDVLTSTVIQRSAST